MTTLLIGLAVLAFMGIPALIFIAACIVGARADQQQEAILAQLDFSPSNEIVQEWFVLEERVEV